MAGYRFFLVDDFGHIFGRSEHAAEDDFEAIRVAVKLSTEHPIEIWHRNRFVKLVKKATPIQCKVG